MKKELIRIGLISFIVAFALIVGGQFLACKVYGNDFDFQRVCMRGLIISFGAALGPILGGYVAVVSRIKYLERKEAAKPPFKFVCSTELNAKLGLDFNCLKNKIADKWVVTFSDETESVLKFRTKLGFLSWGKGAWIKYDVEKIYLECFALSEVGTKTSVQKMQKEIEKCLNLS